VLDRRTDTEVGRRVDPEIVLPVMTGSTEQAMILTRDLGDVRGRRVLVDCTRHRHGMLEFAVALLRILIIDGGAATVAFTDLRDYVDDVVRRPSRSASRTRSARCRGVSSS
jgi:hypothetical protein